MPAKKHAEVFALKGKKTVMHPCQLQTLNNTRFVESANLVLRDQIRLLALRSPRKYRHANPLEEDLIAGAHR